MNGAVLMKVVDEAAKIVLPSMFAQIESAARRQTTSGVKAGEDAHVLVGIRFSAPSAEDAVRDLRMEMDGAAESLGAFVGTRFDAGRLHYLGCELREHGVEVHICWRHNR